MFSFLPFLHSLISMRKMRIQIQKPSYSTPALEGSQEARKRLLIPLRDSNIYANFFLYLYNIYFRQVEEMKIKSSMAILLILFEILFISQQAQVVFRRSLVQSPIGSIITNFNGGNFRGVLKVVGATSYHHVCKSARSYPDINSPQSYAPDECLMTTYGDTYVFQVPYIVQAAGLVKIAMHSFVNGVKKREYYDVTTTFSKPYMFLDLTSYVACKFIVKDILQNQGEWRLVRATDDPLSDSLPILQKNTEYDLDADQVVYLRTSKKGTSMNYRDTIFPKIHTLQTSKCQTACPYSEVFNAWMYQYITDVLGYQPGTNDRCQCNGQKVYDWETSSCLDCSLSANTQKLGCKNLYPPEVVPVCGNGVKETGEQCDNRMQVGCTDCKVASGYTCSQNAKRLSTCTQIVCGNGIKETGEQCDNRKQAGCTDCKVASGYICTEDANKLSNCSIPVQVPFQKLNHKIGLLTTYFYGDIDQKLSVYGQINNLYQGFMKLKLYDPDNVLIASPDGGYTYSPITLTKSGVYKATLVDGYNPRLQSTKIQFKLDDILFKEYYQIMPFQFSGKYKTLYEFTSTKTCKVKAYFNGDGLSTVTEFKITKPGAQLFDQNSPSTYTDNSYLKFTPSQLPFAFDIDVSGKWYIQVYQTGDGSKDLNLELKTFNINGCQNPCTQYLSNPFVLGLASWTTETCLCDDSSTRLIWDSTKKSCEAPVFPTFCGNGIKETGEECDNKKQTGCTDCKVASGYFCSEDQAKLSTCAQNRCGDSKKGGSEECDNGNTTGCIDCKVSSGYECSGGLGQKSTCTGKCGDGIKLAGEECDNGGSAGCTGCKIDPGYNCVHNLYSKSLCLPICGDGIRAITEECDNKNQTGCINCKPVPGFKCSGAVGAISDCKIACGDSVFGGSQQCDNGNQAGCSANCVPDKGYVCKNEVGARSVCSTVCGDGIKAGSEACDNGKKIGCLTCNQDDDGFTCTGAVGQRSTCKSICGDSKRQANEQCDNGNAAGCSKNCLPDIGYTCTGNIGAKSTCQTQCGDSIKAGTEACDNGKKKGCSNCIVQSGYTCKLAANMRTSICTKTSS